MAQTYGVWTRFISPTDRRGSRIRVTWGNDSRIVSYDYAALSAHESAVREAMEGWGQTVESVEHVCPTESGRGSVYSVIVT